jgi:hypothetical protein
MEVSKEEEEKEKKVLAEKISAGGDGKKHKKGE